jgi:non-specific protein-tyrosine kinase
LTTRIVGHTGLQRVKTNVTNIKRLSVLERLFMLKEDVVELRWVFSTIRRWLWLIVGCVLLTTTSAFLVTSRMPSVYSTSTTLLVHMAPAAGVSDYTAIRTSELLVSTYSHMLKGQAVMEAVIARLGLEETPGALAKRVEVKLIKDTQLIQLSVEYTDATQAALIANTIAETFIAQIQALQTERYADSLAGMQMQIYELSALIEETQTRIDGLSTPGTDQEEAELARLEIILAGYHNTHATLQQNYEQMRLTMAQATVNVIVAEMAGVPGNPVRRRTLYTALAAVVGAMLALGMAFLLEYLDDTIKTPDDVGQALGLGTVGAIGRLAGRGEELVVAAQPVSPVAEAFRVLCTNIRFSSINGSLRTIVVTSPGPAESKSIAVANLAVAMAQAGLSVVAVDADLRRPRLHQLFGLDLHEGDTGERLWWGLTGSLLEGRTDGRLHSTQVAGLRVLPSGELPPNPAELMGSQHMQELLHELTQQADVVLIDSPPVLPVADATALAQRVDGVLLVVEAGKTRREAARHAVERLRQVGANLVGVVLIAVPTHKGSYYYHETYGNGRGNRKHRPRRQKERPTARRRLFGRGRDADAD